MNDPIFAARSAIPAFVILAAAAVGGCASVPTDALPMERPLASDGGRDWLMPSASDGVVIDSRAIQAARQATTPAAALNSEGRPRIGLWIGIGAAVHAIFIADEVSDMIEDDFGDAFGCLLTFGLGCDD